MMQPNTMPTPFEVIEEDGRLFILCNADYSFRESIPRAPGYPEVERAVAESACAIYNKGFAVGLRAGMWHPRALWRNRPMAEGGEQ